MSLRVLALSSSRVGNSAYLENAAPLIKDFIGNNTVNIAFIPFATVDGDYDAYITSVREGLKILPYTITLVEPSKAAHVIKVSDVIMVGGGNTFKLLHNIYKLGLYELIIDKVKNGTPYIGWSAGSNITGLTLATTNDMPIIEPESFKAFGFLPFQINPHYLNVKPDGHNGETRDQRLEEFVILNPGVPVVGLPEGAALRREGETLTLLGETGGVLLEFDKSTLKPVKKELSANSALSYLL